MAADIMIQYELVISGLLFGGILALIVAIEWSKIH
uniref:Poxvirus virion envelope protein A14 n=1 Tax=Inoviridae sp. ctO6A5 TaxID=2826760 RepID=A0A8S5M5Q4_9VIRU|nr:MAG TPA: Poxvirus virion envelope protein A14 [Inoviridae sp. ctO6A5]